MDALLRQVRRLHAPPPLGVTTTLPYESRVTTASRVTTTLPRVTTTDVYVCACNHHLPHIWQPTLDRLEVNSTVERYVANKRARQHTVTALCNHHSNREA